MKRFMIVSMAMLLLGGSALAQPDVLWENFYGYTLLEDSFSNLVQTPDGGFLCVGHTGLYPDQPTYLVKIDSDGNEIWSQTYSFSPEQTASDIILTQDDCRAFCGAVGDPYTGNAYLFKFDADGDSLWMQEYDNGYFEYFESVEQTEDGGYILGGASKTSPLSGVSFIVRTDADGNEIWSNTYPQSTSSWVCWVHETDDGGFVMAGTVYTGFMDSQGFLKKVDASGNLLWTQTYAYTAGTNQVWNACCMDDGGYALLYWGANDQKRIIKTDADGNELWNSTFTFGDMSYAFSMDACDDGGFIIAASVFLPLGDTQGGLLRTDSDGNTLWCEIYGGVDSDGLSCVRQTDDGGYIAAGEWGSPTELSAWLLRLDAEGTAYPDVTVDLTYVSGSPIPIGGGDLTYDIDLTNNEADPVNFDAWIDVTLPNSSVITLTTRALTMSGGSSIARTLTLSVPGGAPAGTYSLAGNVGVYPATVWDSSSFDFEKSGSDGVFNPGMLQLYGWDDSAESVIEKNLPAEFALLGAYPNPFNPTTTLGFELPEAARVVLSVYDVSGCLVATLVDGWRDAGSHQVTLDAFDLTSGVYVYHMKAGEFSASGKMILMK